MQQDNPTNGEPADNDPTTQMQPVGPDGVQPLQALQVVNRGPDYTGLTTTEERLLTRLLLFLNSGTGLAFPKQEELGERLGVTSRTIRNNIRTLEAKGWITVERKYRNGNTRNLYTIRVPPLSWESDHPQPETIASGHSDEGRGATGNNSFRSPTGNNGFRLTTKGGTTKQVVSRDSTPSPNPSPSSEQVGGGEAQAPGGGPTGDAEDKPNQHRQPSGMPENVRTALEDEGFHLYMGGGEIITGWPKIRDYFGLTDRQLMDACLMAHDEFVDEDDPFSPRVLDDEGYVRDRERFKEIIELNRAEAASEKAA